LSENITHLAILHATHLSTKLFKNSFTTKVSPYHTTAFGQYGHHQMFKLLLIETAELASYC
jgi:hypothetical protein